jgi:hypothetical protein
MADAIRLADVKFDKETANWTKMKITAGAILPDKGIYIPKGIANEGDEFVLALIPKALAETKS